jgi:hypothetical protein
MRYILLSCALLVTTLVQAQDTTLKKVTEEATKEIKKDKADTLNRKWRLGGLLSLTVSQTTLSNWAAGGDDYSLSLNGIASLYAYYKEGRHSWDNTFDFNYGSVSTTSLDTRKNDDRVDLVSKYGYGISEKWNLSALGNFRTQFFKGYNYDNDVPTFTSDFLSPAYMLFGVGFDYKPNQNFSLYLSPLTARWTLVKNDSLSEKGEYGVVPGENWKDELGAFVSVTYLKTFNKTLSYKGRLDLFSDYKHNPQNIDLFITNLLSVNFTKILSATWNVDFIYDDDVKQFGTNKTSAALQVKSLIGIGLAVTLSNRKTK